MHVIHSVTSVSSPNVKARPRSAARQAPARPLRRLAAPRAARLAAALAGLVAIGSYLFIALSRLNYPFTVEWLEGNSLVEVHRILAGQPLYPAPTAGYVPDGYPPLYFAVSAAAARVLGVSYLPLRLVSLVSSLACLAVLGRLVQRETGSIAAGTGAAGVFAATYFATDTWLDVGRVDSLFLALSIGGLYAARHMRGTRGAIAAGVLLAAAALTKQTGLVEGITVIAALLAGPRRRLACVAALAEMTVLVISTLVLALTTGGWYVYYVFELMGEHSLSYGGFGWFWTALLSTMGIAACAALAGARRVPAVLLAGCAALAAEGCAALVHSGGGINDLLPAYLAVALLAGLALGSVESRRSAVVPGVLVLAQSALLLSGFHPSQAIPASADRAVGRAAGRGHAGVRRDRRGPRGPRPEPDGGDGAGRAPGRGVRRAAGLGPGRDRQLPAQRDGGGRRPPVQRDHHRRPRAAVRRSSLPPPVLLPVPAAAARRCPGRPVPPGRGGQGPPDVRVAPSGWRFLRYRRQHPRRHR